jgi:DNA modification methylase
MRIHNSKYGHVYRGDCLEIMKGLKSNSIDCLVTSPPYWQLRDYGFPGQWGLEPTIHEYLEKLWKFMDEVKRILKNTGTVWINLGDTYGTKSGNFGQLNGSKNQEYLKMENPIKQPPSIHKCLLLIPHRFAIGCIDRGWILRNDIIWGKINPMPESCTDRFSKRHEHVFFFVRNQKYYFDLDSIRDNYIDFDTRDGRDHTGQRYRVNTEHREGVKHWWSKGGKNPGDVSDFWALKTTPSNDEHYASFGTDLIDKPIMAGCPPGGVVLDPFCGSGITLQRAIQLGRKAIGIDGKKEYVDIAVEKMKTEKEKGKLFKDSHGAKKI